MKIFNGVDELRAAAGTHVGASDWMTVDQSRVNTFADATEDHQWIHVDPEKAKDGPFGGTIAHGFLTLSLLSHLLAQVYRIDGIKMGDQLRAQQGAVHRARPGRQQDPRRGRHHRRRRREGRGRAGDHADHRRDRGIGAARAGRGVDHSSVCVTRSSASRCARRSAASAARCATCPAHELAATVVRALLDAHRARPGRRRRRAARPLLPHDGGARDRPGGRAGRGPAGDRDRAADRPALRLRACRPSSTRRCRCRAARRRSCSRAAPSRCRTRRSTRRRCAGARAAAPGCMLHDALARGRVTAGGANFPVPGGMIETAENLRREYGISRAEQDEFAVRSHQRAAAARDEGRFADEIVPVRWATGSSTRRAHPARHDRRGARRAAADHGPHRPGGHGHGGQRVGPERRRRGLRRHAPGAGRGAGAAAAGAARLVGRGRGAARDDGHRAGARHREGARRGRAHAGRHGPHRAERGLRRPGAGLHAGVEAHRRRPRAGQRQRLGDLARPPGRRDRRAHPRHAACARWTAAARATAWRRCASAGGRASPPCSSGWADASPRRSWRRPTRCPPR